MHCVCVLCPGWRLRHVLKMTRVCVKCLGWCLRHYKDGVRLQICPLWYLCYELNIVLVSYHAHLHLMSELALRHLS